MTKKVSLRRHASGNVRKKGNTDQLAAQLAPLEEQDKPAAEQQMKKAQHQRDYGAIVVDNADFSFPKGVVEGGEEKQVLGMEPVVLVVLIIVLGFIAFITWQITLMPAR